MLMRHPSRNVEISSFENDVEYGSSAQELSQEGILLSGLETIVKKFFQRMWLLSEKSVRG